MACDKDDDLSAKQRSASELPLQFPKLSIFYFVQHGGSSSSTKSSWSVDIQRTTWLLMQNFARTNVIGKSRNATRVLTHRETLLNECRSFPHTIIRMSLSLSFPFILFLLLLLLFTTNGLYPVAVVQYTHQKKKKQNKKHKHTHVKTQDNVQQWPGYSGTVMGSNTGKGRRLFSKTSRPAMMPTQPPSRWIQECFL